MPRKRIRVFRLSGRTFGHGGVDKFFIVTTIIRQGEWVAKSKPHGVDYLRPSNTKPIIHNGKKAR